MTDQTSGWTPRPGDSEARWRESDRALKLQSFKVALGIFAALAVGSIVLMMAAHVIFLPFLTLIMGGRAAIIGWQVFGPGNGRPSRSAGAVSPGWQQSAPVPPPPLASQTPQAVTQAPSVAAPPPPPPPPTWRPPADLGDWNQSMPGSPSSKATPPPPPPPPPPPSSG
jgi:hypothetical protein